MEGLIVCPLSGLYLVRTKQGNFRCRARGIFRKNKISPTAGDRVVIEPLSGDEGIITEILPRRNYFIRPNVANIDMICYVLSSRFPEPNVFQIDKMSVLCELKNMQFVLILNKIDLDQDESARKLLKEYEMRGFTVIFTSTTTGQGIERIGEIIQGKTAIFAGNTGVGKSSIINALGFGAGAKVNEISEKLGRGRHTTREVTLFPQSDGGLYGDTPGFGNVDISLENELTADNLAHFFADFRPWSSQCRFADCTHMNENGCMLKEKVHCGEILESRYQSYRSIFDALKERDKLNFK